MISKKESTVPSTVRPRTLFLHLNDCVLFDLDAIHSFISTQTTLQLKQQKDKVWANYKFSFPNEHVMECPILYKQVPIIVVEHEFLGNLILLDHS